MHQQDRIDQNGVATLETGRYGILKDRIAGVLLGTAVADALGWPTEFIKTKAQLQRTLRIEEITDFISWEKRTGGRFNTYIDYIQPGNYSDDTQLALSTARSMRADGSFDGQHFAKVELPVWLSYLRGAGATVTRAATAASKKNVVWDSNFFEYGSGDGMKASYIDAGANGAAMRIAPVALANKDDETQGLTAAWHNAIVTHGHPRAIIGALVYCKALLLLINDEAKDEINFVGSLVESVRTLQLETLPENVQRWMSRWSGYAGIPFSERFEQVRSETVALLTIAAERQGSLGEMYEKLGCLEPATKGSGTGTVAAAIGIFLRHGGNYERAVLRAVNMLGSDTDTIAAMVGGLTCAHGGQMAVPDRWANAMQDYGYFLRVAEALTRISMRAVEANDLTVDHRREEFEDRDVISLTRNRSVHEGQRVSHPLFGLGWVTSVNAQQIKRRGGGTMLLAKTAFDVGQSCVFRSYQPAKR